MRRYIFILILFLTTQSTQALEIDPAYYIYPVENVARLYSANFGELRPDHFHSGVDIKTDGVEGKRVVAVADGYISRLGVSTSGYGLALYVVHPNGTTSVYGHLSKFRGDIAKRVQTERYAAQKHSITLYFKPNEFPVKQGELIAYSGNTGSSSGPHLHYEIRESATQSPINIFAKRIIKPRDTRRPWILKVHYIEVDSLDGVAYHSPRRTYTTLNPSVGQYVLNIPKNEIAVGRSGYFITEVSDRKNDVTNTFGVYSFEGLVDGVQYFKYQMDRFSFTSTRYVNVVSCYALKLGSRNEVIRMALPECGTSQFYPTIKNRGVVSCDVGQRREVVMKAVDDCGLTATLKFNIVGKEQSFKAQVSDSQKMIYAKKAFTHSTNGVEVSIPAGTLYESIPFKQEILVAPKMEIDSTVRVASSIYKILCDSIPLHKAMTISMDLPLDEWEQSKAIIAKLTHKGKAVAVGGEYKGGRISVETRSAGAFFVAIDTTSPTIEFNFEEGENLSKKTSLSFSVRDNFSGIVKYNAQIDGEWVALDSHKETLIHEFITPPTKKEHTIVVELSDNRDNVTIVERKFRR